MKEETTIKVLSTRDQIRSRPSMWIGNTSNPNHLIMEVLDNALDELSNNFADTISCSIDSENLIVDVWDNGRGIPLEEVNLPPEHGEGKIDSVIAIFTKLFSGAKFNNSNYNFSIGTHGVGLGVVNMLSKYLVAEVVENKEEKLTTVKYFFEDGQFEKKEIAKYDKPVPFSTRVRFQVLRNIFEINEFLTIPLENKLKLVKSKFKNSNIIFNNVKYKDRGFKDYVREILKFPKENPLYHLRYKNDKNEVVECYFGYNNISTNSSNNVYGDVNLNPCSGKYLTDFKNFLHSTVIEHLGVDKSTLTLSDISSGLKYYVSLTIEDPKFDSNSKASMNKSVKDLISGLRLDIKKILSTEEHIQKIYNNIIESKSIKKANKKLKGNKTSINNPIKHCHNKRGGKTLYIVEGASAEGTLKQIIDRKTEGLYPLTGKILNSVDVSIDKALENNVIFHLFEGLGVDAVGNSKLRYEKVKIICDADPDGQHIAVLLIILFYRFVKELIQQQRLVLILPPLYGAKKKNQFIPLYNRAEALKYENNGFHIVRFKGLGEMNADDLKLVIQNPKEYIINSPKTNKEAEIIIDVLKDSELKKRILKNKNFNINNLLNSS